MQNKFRKMNDKAKYRLDQLLTELHIASYSEGFEAGKTFGQYEDATSVKPVLVKSPNQKRAELIQKAKDFVKEKQNSVIPGAYVFQENTVLAHFYHKNNRVTCVLKGLSSGRKYNVAHSNCNPTDVFNLYIGQAISLARALKIDVPVEFLEAVQPSELVIGHVTIWSDDFNETYTVNEIRDKKAYCNNSTEHWRMPLSKERLCNIIDDTSAIYEVQS